MASIRVRSDWRGGQILARLVPARRAALRQSGYEWFARTQEIVPLRAGTLQRSGRLEVDGDSARIVYGTPYGAVQHERLDYRHAPGRRAKYISAVTEPDDLRRSLAKELRRLFH